jgi:hypothetical protein
MTGYTTHALALERNGELHRQAREARQASRARRSEPHAIAQSRPRPLIARVSWRPRASA